MGSHEHERAARSVTVPTRIIVVSTSRTKVTDETGPLVASLLRDAGHPIVETHCVPDDPAQIGQTLDAALADPDTRCVLLCGGTGFSARDQTPEVVEARLDRVMPGFGEQFRALSFADVGPAGLLSRATGGVSGDTAVFALPGSPKACSLALETLVLPLLRHLVHQVDKEDPISEASAPEPPAKTVDVVAMEEPAAPEPVDEPTSTWRAGLTMAGGTLGDGSWPKVHPDWPAPVRNVLETAGAQAPVRGPDGEAWAAYGYPDLTRPNSKVLLVGDDWMVALHRHPVAVGLCAAGAPVLPQGSVAAITEEITGNEAPVDGRVVAVDTRTVFVESDGLVHEWDGRVLESEGTTAQIAATLALRWSKR